MQNTVDDTGRFIERTLSILETNIDDMSPELFPPVMNMLLRAGALDAWITPIVMKHGRPAQMLSALCAPDDAERLVSLLFRETSTLGIRHVPIKRFELAREVVNVTTRYGEVGLKIGRDQTGAIVNLAPEFRDCEGIATARDISIKLIFNEALAAASQLQDK